MKTAQTKVNDSSFNGHKCNKINQHFMYRTIPCCAQQFVILIFNDIDYEHSVISNGEDIIFLMYTCDCVHGMTYVHIQHSLVHMGSHSNDHVHLHRPNDGRSAHDHVSPIEHGQRKPFFGAQELTQVIQMDAVRAVYNK